MNVETICQALGEWGLRGFILTGFGFLLLRAASRAPHRVRHGLSLFFLAVLGFLPGLLAIVPDLSWSIGVAFPGAVGDLPRSGIAGWPWFAFWFAGVVVHLASLGRAHLAWRRLLRSSEPVADETRVEELSRQLALKRRVRVSFSRELRRPVVGGCLRPHILLPASAATWSEARLRRVLGHELAHVKRGDLWIQAAVAVICAFHWFNPFCWWLARELGRSREVAADESAVRVTGDDFGGYARDLLEIAREVRELAGGNRARRLAGVAMIGATSSKLEHRIRELLDRRTRRCPAIAIGSALGIAAVGLAATCSLLHPLSDSGDGEPREIELRLSADPFPAD